MNKNNTTANQEKEEQKMDEDMKSDDGALIKGNKSLSVEVKLSDLIRYGALG